MVKSLHSSRLIGRLAVIAAALVGFNTAPALAQGVPAILTDAKTKSEQPLPDFSYAGYDFGESAIPRDSLD